MLSSSKEAGKGQRLMPRCELEPHSFVTPEPRGPGAGRGSLRGPSLWNHSDPWPGAGLLETHPKLVQFSCVSPVQGTCNVWTWPLGVSNGAGCGVDTGP